MAHVVVTEGLLTKEDFGRPRAASRGRYAKWKTFISQEAKFAGGD